jgi:hypothetical protein
MHQGRLFRVTAIPLEDLMSEITSSELEKIRADLLAPDDWGCLLVPNDCPEDWTILDPHAREPWQLLPIHPKERRIRRRIELVE